MPDLKRCSHCGRELPKERFYRNRSTKDGLNRLCKECLDASIRKSKEKRLNPPSIVTCRQCGKEFAQHRRAVYCSDECRRLGNLAVRRENNRKYRAAHAEELNKRNREYHRVNAERLNLARKRRALEKLRAEKGVANG